MAQVKISNATVVYVNPKGFTAKAQVKVLGEFRDEYYKVWTEQKFEKGDVVEVVGDLSVRIEDYKDKRTGEDKVAAAIHVNNPVIKSDSAF
jgi:hypothetical protein